MHSLYLYHSDGRIGIFTAQVGLKQIITTEEIYGCRKTTRVYGMADCQNGLQNQFHDLLEQKRRQGYVEEEPELEYREQAKRLGPAVEAEARVRKVLGTVTVAENAQPPAWF